jgi:hypothetical protein
MLSFRSFLHKWIQFLFLLHSFLIYSLLVDIFIIFSALLSLIYFEWFHSFKTTFIIELNFINKFTVFLRKTLNYLLIFITTLIELERIITRLRM